MRTTAICWYLAIGLTAVPGCGAPAQQHSDAPTATDSGAEPVDVPVADAATARALSKRLDGLRATIESQLASAYKTQNPAEVGFDTLAAVQNAAFDNINLIDGDSAGCSYSMSTLSDHIYVYLSCDDDIHEFEWRP